MCIHLNLMIFNKIIRGFISAWRQGKVGVVTGFYATAYSFLKYFKAWYQDREKRESVAKEQSDSYLAE
ncbi:hypothetical protein EKN36_20375, partial [Enterobacter hormaechei]